MKNNPLFSSFDGVSSKQWKQKIQADLKGADYNDTLIWKSNEGIDVRPFYHADEFDTLPEISDAEATQWHICQTIFVADAKKSNEKAIDALSRGAESIKFIIPNTKINLEELLKSIDTNTTLLYFELQFLDTEYVTEILSKTSKDKVYILTDIIGQLARTGNWFKDLKTDHSIFESIVKSTNSLSIDVALYQNSGATIVQQLAYALAHLNEYFNHLDALLSTEAKKEFNVVFNVSVGTNYFFEIAKLRALRLLFSTLAEAFNFNPQCHIFATPTKRNKTLYDYNTNMLRTTTECMSAILGGSNSVCNLPYDAIYHKDNEFGERISRNQLLVLKHESYFDKVNNPADGNYYVETLTEQISEKALALFKDIESNGGFLNQLKEGTIQRKIKESATKEQEDFNANKLILLGTNKHPNPNDKMKHELELYPFVKHNPVKTLIAPIIENRLAESIEQERINNE